MLTKKEMKSFIKIKLSTDERWIKKALISIFNFQTVEEKKIDGAVVKNNVGFTGHDAELLSSFAKQLLEGHFISVKQMTILKNRMPKYWRQIFSISDIDKLEKSYAKWIIKTEKIEQVEMWK